MSQSPRPKKVAVIGGGAAGMSCAATLAQHPDKFKVTIFERSPVPGGQATTIPIDEARFGASWLNNGVQGGSTIFKHTFNFFKKYNHEPREVQLQVSFGKGVDGFWTNCFPSRLVEQFSGDIKKFGLFLFLVKWGMPVLGLIPIHLMMRLMLFSKGFEEKMVYPLIALFLGTGNQTRHVPSAIVERLFDDPNMRLWDYDKDTLLPNLPTMVTFDNLGSFYEEWRQDLVRRGVSIRLNNEVVKVAARTSKGILLQTRVVNDAGEPVSETGHEAFDDMVFCTLADDALRILGESASLRERLVLSDAKFYDDVTVTHHDHAYFNRQYETRFKNDLCASPRNDAQRQQVEVASGGKNGCPDDDDAADASPSHPAPSGGQGFRPMYFTKSYDGDRSKIEMSFDCSNYQHQLIGAGGREHVYQSIFLDKRCEHLWTMGEISESKIIKRQWWHQLGHRWQHYLRVVPCMRFLNGRNNTYFAGSWTLVNMHELACVSGIAAAYRLGASYQKFDHFAENFFSKYLLLSHGVIFSREEKRRGQNKAK
ncbi:hypothetical protein RB594_002954 [Gaeumannomyces avenae]